jgi:hypothetical protein
MSSPEEYLINNMIKLGWEINNQGTMIKKIDGKIVGIEKDIEWYLDVEKYNKLLNSTLNNNETYTKEWKHATIHLNPETGEIHSDGDDGFIRKWIIDKIDNSKSKKFTEEDVINFIQTIYSEFAELDQSIYFPHELRRIIETKIEQHPITPLKIFK